jgi:anti-repressor protein
MNQNINVVKSVIGDSSIDTVNVREIHKYVESGKDFSNWIKNRIEVGGFIEGCDYVKLAQKGDRQTLIEYYVSFDMAKSIAMMERNSKGQEIRQWFIEREKQLTNSQSLIPTSFSEALKLAYEQSVVIETQKLQLTAASTVIEEMKPAQSFVENFVKNNKSMTLTQAWKGLGLKPNKFNEQLRNDGILCNNNLAKQAHLNAGYFSTKYTEWKSQTLVTPKGILYIAKKYAGYIESNSVN